MKKQIIHIKVSKVTVRGRIMEDVITQFVNKDCKDITVDYIAANLGISKRTIYEIFYSKEDMIRQTLIFYENEEVEKLKKMLEGEKNPIHILFSIFDKISTDISYIGISKIVDIRYTYPAIADEIIEHRASEIKKIITSCLEDCKRKKLVFDFVEPDLIFRMIYLFGIGGKKNPLIKRKNISQESFLKIFILHIYIVIRGVCTLKGTKFCDEYLEQIRKTIDI